MCYAVKRGWQCGVYRTWDQCKINVDGYSNAKFKAFQTYEEAVAYMNAPSSETRRTLISHDMPPSTEEHRQHPSESLLVKSSTEPSIEQQRLLSNESFQLEANNRDGAKRVDNLCSSLRRGINQGSFVLGFLAVNVFPLFVLAIVMKVIFNKLSE